MTVPVDRPQHQVRTLLTACENLTGHPMMAEWTFDTHEPFAVQVVVQRVKWMFARDLLASGMLATSGDGDVRVEPDAEFSSVIVHLSSPDGQASLEFDMVFLGEWMDSIYALVPAGKESKYFDLDDEIGKLAKGCWE